MKRTVTAILSALMLLAAAAHAQPLPADSDMTVQVLKLSPGSWTVPYASTPAHTDADGKLAFSFPTVPADDQSPLLLVRIVYNGSVLRQTVVPAPDKDGAVDAGISEVSDLQARALLAARSASGRLTPVHLLAALTLLRSPAISTADAERTGPALNAAADAFYAALARNATQEEIAAFDTALLAGLRRTMTLYRQSVETAVAADPTVEAASRSQAFIQMMKELIDAAATAGLPLDGVDGAYIAAGGAAESALTRQNVSAPSLSLIRIGFVAGMLQCQARQVVRGTSDALASLGFAPTDLPRYYYYLNILAARSNGIGAEYTLLTPYSLDTAYLERYIFNMLAQHDLVWFSSYLQLYGSTDLGQPPPSEFDTMLADVIARMAENSGVMNSMTVERLGSIMGAIAFEPFGLEPIGRKFLPVWYYLKNTPNLTYTPIPNLSSGFTNPPAPYLFDQLDGPYRALAQLQYDLTLVALLNSQDEQQAESLITMPPWLSLATLDKLKQKDQERRAEVRARIGGISETEKDAIIAILYPTGMLY